MGERVPLGWKRKELKSEKDEGKRKQGFWEKVSCWEERV